MILKEMWKSKNHFEPGTKKKGIFLLTTFAKKKKVVILGTQKLLCLHKTMTLYLRQS